MSSQMFCKFRLHFFDTEILKISVKGDVQILVLNWKHIFGIILITVLNYCCGKVMLLTPVCDFVHWGRGDLPLGVHPSWTDTP